MSFAAAWTISGLFIDSCSGSSSINILDYLPVGVRDFGAMKLVNPSPSSFSSTPVSTFSAINPGDIITWTVDPATLTAPFDSTLPLYACFLSGSQQINQALSSASYTDDQGAQLTAYTAEVPESLGSAGAVYMVMFQDDSASTGAAAPTLSDDNAVAGPAFFMFRSGDDGAYDGQGEVSVQF